MIWQQTLVITIAPVIVTTVALFLQQKRSDDAAHRRDQAAREATLFAVRREESRAAHLEMMEKLACFTMAFVAIHNARMDPTGDTAAGHAVPPPQAHEEAQAALDRLVLTASQKSADAAAAYMDAIHEVDHLFSFPGPANADELDGLIDARSEYIQQARADIGVG